MVHDINLGGTIYISSKRAAEITGYAQDYVGQLARAGSIEAKRVSGLWYVIEASLIKYKESADEYKPEPPSRDGAIQNPEVTVSFDGKDYISAHRASKITGYNQDYVGHLARSGQILSRQIGNRWYVDRESLLVHKNQKDSMLASVQSDSVGLEKVEEPIIEAQNTPQEADPTHFKYIPEENAPIPQLTGSVSDSEAENQLFDPSGSSSEDEYSQERDEVHQIAIRVVSKEPQKQSFYDYSADSQDKEYLKSPKRKYLFAVTALSTLAVAATIVYIGGIMGFFSLMNKPVSPKIEQNATSERSLFQKSINEAQSILLTLFSTDLDYKRSEY